MIVHELSHVFISGMQAMVNMDDSMRLVLERTTEELAQAIVRVRNWSWAQKGLPAPQGYEAPKKRRRKRA